MLNRNGRHAQENSLQAERRSPVRRVALQAVRNRAEPDFNAPLIRVDSRHSRTLLVRSLTLSGPPSSLRPMSKLPFELFLAVRYLRPKRTFVSIITLISIVGVMLGVAVLIVVISVMSGFDRQMRDKILGFNAHLRVQREGLTSDYQAIMKIVGSNATVKADSRDGRCVRQGIAGRQPAGSASAPEGGRPPGGLFAPGI